MDENCLQAYLELIQSLLTCPSGEETQTLQANPELVDAGLVQVMLSVADQMAAEENGNASWLRKYAVEIAHSLGIVAATPEEYLQFLMQLLRAIIESDGNPQVIYPLLQANLDKLDDGLTQILRVWGATTFLTTVESQQAQFIAAILFILSNFMKELPLGNKASNLETLIAYFHIALEVYIREPFPVDWAMIQDKLASAHSERILGDKAQNLTEITS
ncbi:MAG: hypothetical protein F6K41_09060 [Symploca sp. SIO3E6]|nr:hypothetical protein [Caldora sp. SIO3E6]